MPSFQVHDWIVLVPALIVLVGAFWVVSLRNLFRAALSLGVVLVGVAGCFILLEAEFLAFVQILVYVGAILTLIVFAIMLTTRHPVTLEHTTPRNPILAAVSCLALFGILVRVLEGVPLGDVASVKAVDTAELGQQLVTTLVLPFEVISLVFVAAMVGAIVLATRGHNPVNP